MMKTQKSISTRQQRASEIIQKLRDDFPVHELYRFFNRFFVSGEDHFSGWVKGEKEEPGFLKSCLFTFFYELEHIDQLLSSEMVDSIHRNIIYGVLNTNYTQDDYALNRTSFRELGHYVQFGLIPGQNLSIEGFKEIQNELPRLNVCQLVNVPTGKRQHCHYVLACFSDNAEDHVKNIIADYHEKMYALKEHYQNIFEFQPRAIEIISRLVTDLERLHPYKDGNCRTFCIIVLNRELIKNGMDPTIIDDPNQFEGFSQKESVQKIIEGQARYRELLTQGQLKTPFRSGKVFLKETGLQIKREDLSNFDLTDIKDFQITDDLEYDLNGVPYIGEPENSAEMIFHRLILESAFLDLHEVLQNENTYKLLQRLNHASNATGLSSLEMELQSQYQTYFYCDNLMLLLKELGHEVSVKIIQAGLNFGAKATIALLFGLMKETQTNLADYISLEGYSPIGYCLTLGRFDFACKIVQSAKDQNYSFECVKQDVKTALENKDFKTLFQLRELFIKTRMERHLTDPALFVLLQVACAYDALSQTNERNVVSDTLRPILRYFSIKTSPTQEAKNLLDQLVEKVYQTECSPEAFVNWYQIALKKCSSKVLNTLENMNLSSADPTVMNGYR